MSKESFVNEIVDKYKNMSGFKCTIGSRGIYTECESGIVGVLQYNFYKFEE